MNDFEELDNLKKYVQMKRLSSKLSNGEAALVISETNVRYLTDFPKSEGYLFVTKDQAYLMVDSRYGEAASRNVKNAKVIVFEDYTKTLIELIKETETKNLLIEVTKMTVFQMTKLERNLKETDCYIVSNDRLDKLIASQRMIKSIDEIEKIRKAQQITEEAYLEILNMVKPGVKESQLAFELEFLMRKKGAEGISFDLITIAGAKTSMPHGVPDDNEIKRGDFVTFDIGALYEGYHSDMTRTVVVGEVSDPQIEIYDVVYKAQTMALSKVRPGAKAYDIDSAARGVIARAGYADYYKHSTGHGVGLEIHENPIISVKNETLLSENMVITVEPGIYLPGKFGVRIEDMVLVTKDGYENFATVPKELTIV